MAPGSCRGGFGSFAGWQTAALNVHKKTLPRPHVRAAGKVCRGLRHLAAPWPAIKPPSGILGKLPFCAKSWPGAFWKQISGVWRPVGRLLNSPSGILGKRPFWAKSWPGAFWKRISGVWRPLSRLLNPLLGSLGNGRFVPNPGQEPFGSKFLAFGGPSAGY